MSQWGRLVIVMALVVGAHSGMSGADRQQVRPTPANGAATTLSSNDQPDDAIVISGSERLAWDFAAKSPEEVGSLRFVAFVDDTETALVDVSCDTTDGPLMLSCTAPLPPLSRGTHTIQVAAFGEGEPQGPRSDLIRVWFDGPSSGTAPVGQAGEVFTTRDGVRLQATVLAAGLADPTDLAIVPDGRILIAERAGQIRLVRDGQLLSVPSLRLSDAVSGDGRGLLAIAVDTAFDETHAVYALYTAESGARLVRYVLRGDTLIDRAVLLDALPLSSHQPGGMLRMGPDFRLYVGLDDDEKPSEAGDLGSYRGKVLRFSRDGTTPADSASPIFLSGVLRPTGMAWRQDSPGSWVLTRDAEGTDRVYTVNTLGAGAAVTLTPRHTLPRGVDASDLLLYDSTRISEFRGDLLVAANGARALLRLNESGAQEWLMQESYGSLRAIGVGPDGAIYAVSEGSLLRIDLATARE